MKNLQTLSTSSITLEHQLANFLEAGTKWVYSLMELLDSIKLPPATTAADRKHLPGIENGASVNDYQHQLETAERLEYPAYSDVERLDDQRDGRSEQGLLNFSSELADATKNIISISDVFSELHPSVKKVEAAADMVDGLMKGQQGFADLLKEGNEQSAVGLIGSFAKILAGGIKAAAAGLEFGPEGALAALAIYTVVETADLISQRDNQIAKKNKQAERQAQRALKTFEMSEKDAGYLMKDPSWLQPITTRNWQLPYSMAMENVKKYGASAYDLHFDMPMATADVLKPHYPPGYKEEEHHLPKKKSYLEQTFELQQRLNSAGLTSGLAGFRDAAASEIANAKRYDHLHHTNTADMTYSAVQETLGNFLTQSNEHRKLKYQNGRQINGIGDARRGAGESSRTVVVNVTRPLIEHFTINVKDTKEAVGDLKRKVEEALLEILNNTNVK